VLAAVLRRDGAVDRGDGAGIGGLRSLSCRAGFPPQPHRSPALRMTDAAQKACILVVDDDSSVLVSLALLLKQSGFEVLTCDDPAEVPGLLASRRVDLVLQDMNFSPRTSGEEGLALLEQTRAQHPALPVLLMTAWGS